MISRSLPAVALTALLGLAASPASAQSLLANRGLGLVVEPTDARSQGLGGVTLGLGRGGLAWANPAELQGLEAPGLRVVFQFDDFSAEYGTREASGSTARFPLIQAAFPAGERLTLAVGYGGFLDQNWAVERPDTMRFGADTVAVLDRLSSEGGVARLRFGAGVRVVPSLSVGGGLDLYTGSVERAFGRQFTGEQAPECCRASWRYRGLGGNAGVAWNPTEALNLSVAATFGGTLDAETDDEQASDASFSLPTTLQAGASARVSANALLAVSGEWAGWSALDEELTAMGGARDSWSLRGGLEWDAVQLRDRPVPIRLGARRSELPFRWGDASAPTDWITESALTSGVGLVLAGGATRSDLALELGRRGGDEAGLSESYWRMTFSVTVLGR